MGYSKSSPEGEIHHNTSIHPKTGKNSSTKVNLAPKGAGEKRADRSYIQKKKKLKKIIAELNEIETRRTVEQINKTRSWFFERINRIDKPLASLIKNKREKTLINKIMNEKVENTTNTKEIQNILKTYYEQLYTNNLGNLEEMDAFLENHKLPKLEQEEIENLNRPITREEIEAVIKKLPNTQKSTDRWLPWGILSNVSRRNHTYSTKAVWKERKRWSTSKFVL